MRKLAPLVTAYGQRQSSIAGSQTDCKVKALVTRPHLAPKIRRGVPVLLRRVPHRIRRVLGPLVRHPFAHEILPALLRSVFGSWQQRLIAALTQDLPLPFLLSQDQT